MIRARYRRILAFFARAIAGVLYWDFFLSSIGMKASARRTRAQRMKSLAIEFRELAIEMGGVMIKVGQFLSSRVDVLPREVTAVLADLQDEVSPETFDDIRRVLETSLGAPLESKFDWFEEQPMASASIGQAHRARLTLPDENGNPQSHAVVVKVQRPNIREIVATDLAALARVSGWLHRFRTIRKHANVPALMGELSRAVELEMDYLHEGRNAEQFAENFKDDPGVLVPQVFWEVTTREVITLADVQAIKITDYQSIEAAGISRSEVADRLFNVYLKQILEDRFFHADPHPGNLFVEPVGEKEDSPRKWRLVFVDFGMAGEISPRVMEGLREAVIALGTTDAARMVQAEQKLNFLLPSADLALLERAYQRLFERFSGKSTRDMMKMHGEETAAFFEEFSQLIYELPYQLPENMILLGRCFSILSGICTGLDPAFNLWTSVGPYTTRLMDMQGERGLEYWLKELLDTLLVTVSLPRKMEGLIRHIESGKLEVSFTSLEQKITQLERSQWRFAEAILFSVFFFAAVQLFLADQVGLAAIPAAFAIFVLVLLIFERRG